MMAGMTEVQTLTLAEFLLARVAEDEATAAWRVKWETRKTQA
jgi:hypothetical protein